MAEGKSPWRPFGGYILELLVEEETSLLPTLARYLLEAIIFSVVVKLHTFMEQVEKAASAGITRWMAETIAHGLAIAAVYGILGTIGIEGVSILVVAFLKACGRIRRAWRQFRTGEV
jgi:hypothetical protein